MLLFLSVEMKAQTTLSVGVPTNIRALAVVDSLHWWFGGSDGWLGHTADGGKSWQLQQPAGAGVDFRSLHAFNALEAVAAIAGQPAQIYRTADGGLSWEMVHQLPDSTAFIDAIGFWNDREGLLFGDPMPDGRLLLLRTADGGRSWQALPDSSRPLFYPGEAAFAASGTAMQCVGDSSVAIVSGGSRSRLFSSSNRGQSWQVVAADRWQPAKWEEGRMEQQSFGLMQHGSASQGAFSVGSSPQGEWVLVGGDYLRDSMASGHFLIRDASHWWRARQAPRGYRECIAFVNDHCWVVTGPTGSEVSWNAGLDWQPLNDLAGMHVAKKLGAGVLLAGKGGQLWHYAHLEPPTLPDSIAQVSLVALEKMIEKEVKKRRKPQMMPEGYRSFERNQAELDSLIPLLPGVVAWSRLPECDHYFIGCGFLFSWEYALKVNTSVGLKNVFVVLAESYCTHRLPFWRLHKPHRDLRLRKFELFDQLERNWFSRCDHLTQLTWQLEN